MKPSECETRLNNVDSEFITSAAVSNPSSASLSSCFIFARKCVSSGCDSSLSPNSKYFLSTLFPLLIRRGLLQYDDYITVYYDLSVFCAIFFLARGTSFKPISSKSNLKKKRHMNSNYCSKEASRNWQNGSVGQEV